METKITLSDEASDNLACFDVMRLATMRAAELAAFESHVNDLTARAVSALQRMPVRLRRRAASHRVNRLPYRLHRHHNFSQQKSESVKQVKKIVHKLKSRRFRRRKLRLIAKHARLVTTSQTDVSGDRKPYWLPTHIWHAKRFHMTTEWGWRLPVSPTNKVFKACHKASHRGCIVFDLSYFSCFQLSGFEEIVGSCINECFLPDTQIHTFLPQKTKWNTPQWSCEQTGILFSDFKPVAYDEQIARPILGPARVLWGSTSLSTECVRNVWIWIHPSISKLAWDLFQAYIFKSSANDLQHCLSLEDMTGKFCRLRTLGSQSHGLLSDFLTSDQFSQKDLTKEWKVWNMISKLINQAVCTPSGLVITLSNCAKFLANRPRLKIRNHDWSLHKSDKNSPEKLLGESNNEDLMISQIIYGKQLFWSDIQNYLPDILTMSPEKLLSVKANELEDSLSVVLIQNGTPSLFRHSPESIGWDVIFRRSSTALNEESVLKGSLAARDFLIASVYRGAEVGGIRELRYWGGIGTCGSAVSELFPYSLWPDTAVGKEISSKYTADKIAHFNRLPQHIRPNYHSFGTTSPFSYPWSELISAYSQVASDSHVNWFVLRDPALLRLVVHRMVAGDFRARLSIEQLNKYNPLLINALILVRLTIKSHGVPRPHAIIYLANGNHLKRYGKSMDNQEQISKHLVLGYVQEGGYSMSVGHCVAFGFISLAALSYGLTNSANSNSSQTKLEFLFKNSTSQVLKSTNLSVVI